TLKPFLYILNQSALLVRGLSLSLGKTLVDIHVLLATRNFTDFIDALKIDGLMTVGSLIACSIDILDGKTIDKQGVPTQVLSVIGTMSFGSNLLILAFGSLGGSYFAAINGIFSNYEWFLKDTLRARLSSDMLELGGLPAALFFFVG